LRTSVSMVLRRESTHDAGSQYPLFGSAVRDTCDLEPLAQSKTSDPTSGSPAGRGGSATAGSHSTGSGVTEGLVPSTTHHGRRLRVNGLRVPGVPVRPGTSLPSPSLPEIPALPNMNRPIPQFPAGRELLFFRNAQSHPMFRQVPRRSHCTAREMHSGRAGCGCVHRNGP